MQYNIEERRFKVRERNKITSLIVIILVVVSYCIYEGKGEFFNYAPVFGAMLSAFLTMYSVFTLTIYMKTMKRY